VYSVLVWNVVPLAAVMLCFFQFLTFSINSLAEVQTLEVQVKLSPFNSGC